VSTYVTNVDVSAAPTSPAEAAAAEVARLGRLIANLNEHAALCEHPTVNRALQSSFANTLPSWRAIGKRSAPALPQANSRPTPRMTKPRWSCRACSTMQRADLAPCKAPMATTKAI
jgi:hypothetical protein